VCAEERGKGHKWETPVVEGQTVCPSNFPDDMEVRQSERRFRNDTKGSGKKEQRGGVTYHQSMKKKKGRTKRPA